MECWFVAFRLLNFAEKYLQNVSLPTRTFIIKSSIPAPMTKNNGRNLYTPRRWLKAEILVPNMSLNFFSQPSERRHVHTLCVAYLKTRNIPKPLVFRQQALNLNCKQFMHIDVHLRLIRFSKEAWSKLAETMLDTVHICKYDCFFLYKWSRTFRCSASRYTMAYKCELMSADQVDVISF